MVTRDKSHICSSLDEFLDGFTDSIAKRIRETYGGEKGQLRFDQAARLFVLKVIVCLLHSFKFIKIEVTVAEGEGLQASRLVLSQFSTGDNLLNDDIRQVLVFLTLSEILLLVSVVELACAHWYNIFRGTFDNKAYNMAVLTLESISDSHSLAVGAEGDPKLKLLMLLSLNKLFLYVDTIVGKKLEEADFDWAANGLVVFIFHLHVSVTVQDYAVPEHVLNLKVALNLISIVGVVSNVDARNSHVTCGKRSSLAGKDVDDLSGGFEGVQVLDEQVLLLKRVD